jgi:hypothetical protein
MNPHEREVVRRENLARQRIAEAADGTEEGAAVGMFVNHHLSELEPPYWVKHFGQPRPSREAVIKGLVLHKHWGEEDEDGIDVFDFTLPGRATDYKLAVYFESDGTVDHLTMES